MEKNSRANIAKVVYNVWLRKGEPQTISASDVLVTYRQEISDITSTRLAEELYFMVD